MTLKKILLAAVTALAFSGSAYAAPDLTDLLRGAAGAVGGNTEDGSSKGGDLLNGIKGAVEEMIGKTNLTAADIAGDWKYSAPAVSFRSDNLLQKAGGAAAAGVIEGKIAPYYKKLGVEKLTASFTAEGEFSIKIGKVTLDGTFEPVEGVEGANFVFNIKAGKKLPLGKFNAEVKKTGNKMTLTFDASKLISLLNTVAQISGQGSLKAVASMLNSYEGLNLGFELQK